MKVDFSVKDAVTKRYSVRNYSSQPVEEEKQIKIKRFIEALGNPLGKK